MPLVPHRSDAAGEGALPGGCRGIPAVVREGGGPVRARAAGERPNPV
ncbi:hypothetical protein [Streptomyces fuscichromogenes]|nr:hypothetical protein [Streptomyces fuscichromogenes]